MKHAARVYIYSRFLLKYHFHVDVEPLFDERRRTGVPAVFILKGCTGCGVMCDTCIDGAGGERRS